MRKVVLFLMLALAIQACRKENEPVLVTLTETPVYLRTHKLMAYSWANKSDYLVVFESGLGNGHSVWLDSNIIQEIGQISDILVYDRAGYEKSESGPAPRSLAALSEELGSVIGQFCQGRKVILVSHSFGGLVIRDFAIKNPGQVAAMLMIDPTHEQFALETINQEMVDAAYADAVKTLGANSGFAMELHELFANIQYASTLPNLPDVPVTVITSMKVDTIATPDNRERWYQAHEQLRKGVSHFTHISTLNSGHYIQVEEPQLITDNLKMLIRVP